jgi:hypothetical protein
MFFPLHTRQDLVNLMQQCTESYRSLWELMKIFKSFFNICIVKKKVCLVFCDLCMYSVAAKIVQLQRLPLQLE